MSQCFQGICEVSGIFGKYRRTSGLIIFHYNGMELDVMKKVVFDWLTDIYWNVCKQQRFYVVSLPVLRNIQSYF
jgi:hypothetical protein